MFIIMIIFMAVFFGAMGYVFYKDSQKTKVKKNGNNTVAPKSDNKKENNNSVEVKSSQDLLEFEELVVLNEEHALIKCENNRFVGICEVGGLNFNLLSDSERLLLEDSFAQLLNGIDYPIQFYILSKKIDLDTYRERYEQRLGEMHKDILELKAKIESDSENLELMKVLTSKERGYEYTQKSIKYFLDRTINSELLERKYYIIVSASHNNSSFEHEQSENEILEDAYNEVYNKIVVLLDTLSRHNLQGKMLGAYDLGDLLYTCYNKEDSSLFKFKNAVKARYNHLYTTSKPLDLKMLQMLRNGIKDEIDELDTEISKKAKEEVHV